MAGCGNNKQSGNLITVDVTANYPKKELILQDIFEVEYVPLETNDEFITSGGILAVGKEIMAFLNMGRFGGDGNLYLFDRKGKGIRVINRSGQSGEEYANIHEVILDEVNNEFYINSLFTSMVLVYDLSGNFKRSFKQRENFFYNRMGDFDRDYLICHDGHLEFYKEDVKRNFFMVVSKQDGQIEEISIPYEKIIVPMTFNREANGRLNDRSIYNRELIRFGDSWLLMETSSDTIYRYSQDHTLTPFIVRSPSVKKMDPEIFLYPGVLTGRYYFLQAVKKEYDYVSNSGFPTTNLVYDNEEGAIFEYTAYNGDFITKKSMSLVWEYPMFLIINNEEIAFAKRLEAHELVEAYGKGELKGELKEIAATLDEESNPVIMLVKHKK